MPKWAIASGFAVAWVFMTTAAGKASDFDVRFERLEDYAQAKSPRAEILVREYGRVRAERDEELRWSNPELSCDRQGVDQANEYDGFKPVTEGTVRLVFRSPSGQSFTVTDTVSARADNGPLPRKRT